MTRTTFKIVTAFAAIQYVISATGKYVVILSFSGQFSLVFSLVRTKNDGCINIINWGSKSFIIRFFRLYKYPAGNIFIYAERSICSFPKLFQHIKTLFYILLRHAVMGIRFAGFQQTNSGFFLVASNRISRYYKGI